MREREKVGNRLTQIDIVSKIDKDTEQLSERDRDSQKESGKLRLRDRDSERDGDSEEVTERQRMN